MTPKVSSLSTEIRFRHLKMQFSKTTCFVQAQLMPVLCLWSRISPAASPNPAAPLPAPDTLPTLAGRIFVCLARELGWELVQLESNFCTQLTCKELWQYQAGHDKGQRWAILGWARAKPVVSSCSLLLLSQNVTGQRPWPLAAHTVLQLCLC